MLAWITVPPPRTATALRLCKSARLALAAALIAGCGEDPPSSWDLGPEPRLVGIRVEVVEQGPFDVELLAVPADRTRLQPLPGDVIEPRLSIVDETGIVDAEAFAPIWMLCPATGTCLSTLRRRTAGPCDDWEGAEATACRLGEGDGRTIEVPTAVGTRTEPILRIAAVAGLPGQRTSEQCLADLAKVAYDDDLADCGLAYAPLVLGPSRALEVIRHEVLGMPSPPAPPQGEDPLPLPPATPEQPGFNPEVPAIRLVDPAFEVTASFDEATLLPPGRRLKLDRLFDPRDVTVGGQSEGVAARVFCSQPGVLEPEGFGFGFAGTPDYYVHTGEVGQRFDLFVVVDTLIGGHALAAFSFRVAQD